MPQSQFYCILTTADRQEQLSIEIFGECQKEKNHPVSELDDSQLCILFLEYVHSNFIQSENHL